MFDPRRALEYLRYAWIGGLVWTTYYGVLEGLWGRSLGKRLLGLRVIRDGGYPINLTSSAIRNVLRFLDLGVLPAPPLLLYGLPGLISIFLSPQYKRLGDWAAGTLVIVESGISPFNALRSAGDMAPLTDIAMLCAQYEAQLIVDEAHATGVIGEKGEGLVCQLGLQDIESGGPA